MITLRYVTLHTTLSEKRQALPVTSVNWQQSDLPERRTEKVSFRFPLNTSEVLDDVTSNGRLFHVVAAASTGKARSSIVQKRIDGTASAEVEDKHSCCQLRIWATGCIASAR